VRRIRDGCDAHMKTDRKIHSVNVRMGAIEQAALDFLTSNWSGTPSEIVRRALVLAAHAEMEQLTPVDSHDGSTVE